MEQVNQSPNRSSLLKNAISRLSPEVFSHPAWVRFGEKDVSVALHTVDDLLSTVKNLQKNEPSAACQVLLICAVYQNYAGQAFKALRTTQQALTLSQSNKLAKETIWALWGLCALSIQQGNHEQACTHLIDLQAALAEQNEWMLANFVDVFRQALPKAPGARAGDDSKPPVDHGSSDTMDFTFDWLLHWGFSAQGLGTEFDISPGNLASHATGHSELTHSFFSIQHLQGRWHTLMLAIRGELRLQWKENDSIPSKRRFSFWGSILSSIRLHFAGRSMDTQEADVIPRISDKHLLIPENESTPPKAVARRKKAATTTSKVNKNHHPGKPNTFIPVSVHMLGTFSMAIGNQTVKLPTSRGTALLKYLLIHHKQMITREVLMDVFWPDAEPETARNNLNVTLHNLRKALRTSTFLPIVLFEDGGYGIDSNLEVWVDVEEFERCVQAGRQLEARSQLTAAVKEYETAISLYRGDFLEQNPYEEWTILDRERLRVAYLDTLDHLSQIYFNQERYAQCIAVCQLLLIHDRCNEDAHCLLMRCYCRQGQYHLALRQYQVCREALDTELGVEPASQTALLYEQIQHRERV